jgi:hypothetical protein
MKEVTVEGHGDTPQEASDDLRIKLVNRDRQEMPATIIVEKYCTHPYDRGRDCSVCGQYVRGDTMG